MLKRKTGIILLTLLFVTGLAGSIGDNTITKSERKAAILKMKSTYKEAVSSASGLSKTQLNFSITEGTWSIKDCFYHMATAEKLLWNIFEKAMEAPANPEKRTEIKVTDEQVIIISQDSTRKVQATDFLQPKNSEFTSFNEALVDFENSRDNHIKYLKNTTEDLRNHVVQLPFGWIDCYQLVLFIAGHTNRYTQQMIETRFKIGMPSN